MDRGIQSSLPSLAGESLAARLHLQGVPVDLGEYKLLIFWAISQRITQNFESKDLSMVASGCLTGNCILLLDMSVPANKDYRLLIKTDKQIDFLLQM